MAQHLVVRTDMNFYAYVRNNPIIWFDPTGEARKPFPKQLECLVYEARVKAYCHDNKCLPGDSCLMLILKIAIKQACITAQTHFTEECFPDNPTHKERIRNEKNGIKKCEEYLKTCNTCPAN